MKLLLLDAHPSATFRDPLTTAENDRRGHQARSDAPRTYQVRVQNDVRNALTDGLRCAFLLPRPSRFDLPSGIRVRVLDGACRRHAENHVIFEDTRCARRPLHVRVDT